ncbi:MAG: nicotinate phosphoribosyltransferase, partial [Euryarchaeota archaeon]|nr:nicotinate phosphoribosyltransferase [Euryarchaeota archaeon]
EHQIKELIAAGADAFGVGTYISGAPPVDFALDIVQVNGKPAAKRGKLSGKKQVYRCWNCLADIVVKFNEKPSKCKKCKGKLNPMLQPLIVNGKLVRKLPSAQEIREKVLNQLGKISQKQ